MKKLKKFKIKPSKEKIPCDICEKSKEIGGLCSIRIGTYDISRRYRTSNRPMISNYKLRCCPTCFKIIMKKIENII